MTFLPYWTSGILEIWKQKGSPDIGRSLKVYFEQNYPWENLRQNLNIAVIMCCRNAILQVVGLLLHAQMHHGEMLCHLSQWKKQP